MSDTGNLFVVNDRTKMLIRYYPGNRGVQYYDLSQLAAGEWNAANFDFIPFGNDFVVIFYGNLYRYDLKTQVVTPIRLIPDEEIGDCTISYMGLDIDQRKISRFDKTDKVLVCNEVKFQKTTEHLIRIYGISVLDISTGRMSLLDEISKPHSEDPSPPWYLLLAGDDGNIYLQYVGPAVARFNPQNNDWADLRISKEADQLINFSYFPNNGSLELVDRASNLYFGYRRTDIEGLIKVTPQGEMAWAVTHQDLGIPIETGDRHMKGYLLLLGVKDNGNLLIWSTPDYEKGNYQVHECSIH